MGDTVCSSALLSHRLKSAHVNLKVGEHIQNEIHANVRPSVKHHVSTKEGLSQLVTQKKEKTVMVT